MNATQPIQETVPSTLLEGQWSKIYGYLLEHPRAYAGREQKCLRFIEAVAWMARAGCPWRMLPASYGNWNSIYKRFARWCDNGVWADLHKALLDEPDMRWGLIDSTIVRAHACAAGALKKREVRHLKLLAAHEADSLRKSTS